MAHSTSLPVLFFILFMFFFTFFFSFVSCMSFILSDRFSFFFFFHFKCFGCMLGQGTIMYRVFRQSAVCASLAGVPTRRGYDTHAADVGLTTPQRVRAKVTVRPLPVDPPGLRSEHRGRTVDAKCIRAIAFGCDARLSVSSEPCGRVPEMHSS